MNRDLERILDKAAGACVERMIEEFQEGVYEDLNALELEDDVDVAEVAETLVKLFCANIKDEQENLEGSIDMMLNM